MLCSASRTSSFDRVPSSLTPLPSEFLSSFRKIRDSSSFSFLCTSSTEMNRIIACRNRFCAIGCELSSVNAPSCTRLSLKSCDAICSDCSLLSTPKPYISNHAWSSTCFALNRSSMFLSSMCRSRSFTSLENCSNTLYLKLTFPAWISVRISFVSFP